MGQQNKRNYHHGELHTELLSQSPALIVEMGLEKFTLRELARRIGVTHAAIYRHFSDKRDLLVELSRIGHIQFAQALSRCHHEKLDTTMENLARCYYRWAVANPGLYAVMFGPRLNEDKQYPELETAIAGTLTTVDKIFMAHGFTAKRSRELCVGMMTLLHGYTDLITLHRIRAATQRQAESFLKQAMSAFVAGACLEAKTNR